MRTGYGFCVTTLGEVFGWRRWRDCDYWIAGSLGSNKYCVSTVLVASRLDPIRFDLGSIVTLFLRAVIVCVGLAVGVFRGERGCS